MEAATGIELDGQYRALREAAGMLRRRSQRPIAVSGEEAADYLQGQLTNDVEALAPPPAREADGGGCYAALLDRKGHMQGETRVLRTGPGELLLLVEEAGAAAVLRHLTTYRIGREVEVADRSGELAVLSLLGPAATGIALGGPLAPEHAHRAAELGSAAVRAVATDLGVDLLVAPDRLERVERALIDAGAVPIEEAAAEIVRVESGRPRFGREMSTATIPAEAGLDERAVSFTKGCYIGQETVARLHYKGRPNRHLRGLRAERPLTAGDPVRLGERELGCVGTAAISPALGPIALAILRREAEPGAAVIVGDGLAAEVVELPFAPR